MTNHLTPSLLFNEISKPHTIMRALLLTIALGLYAMSYGQQNEKARTHITDNELLSLFNKTQNLSDDQKKTVMDLLSAFLLKASLRQELTH